MSKITPLAGLHRLRATSKNCSPQTNNARRLSRLAAPLKKAGAFTLCAAVLAQTMFFASPAVAQKAGQKGASATPAGSKSRQKSELKSEGKGGTRGLVAGATVNVEQLARQEALAPQSPAPAQPRAIHPPLSEPFEGQPPAGWTPPAPAATSSSGPPAGGEEPQPLVPSPAFSTNFLGSLDNQTVIPPDTMGAVGPNHVVTALNDLTNIKTRAGVQISGFSTNSFWDPLEATIGYALNVFDPKIHYDRFTERWIYTITANAQSANSALLLAVSRTSDPTGTWNLYGVDAEATDPNWADYPSIGFNANWIVVQVNMFTNATNAFVRPDIYIFDKADAIANSASISFTKVTGTNSTSGTGMGGSTWAPSIDADNASPGTLWFIQNWNPTNGLIRVSKLTGAVGSETITPGVQFPQAPFSWGSQPVLIGGGWAPQANDTKTGVFATHITNNDARMQNVVYRNGTLWAAHTAFGPTVKQPAGTPANSAANPTNHSYVQWWQVDPTIEGNAIGPPLQRADIEDPLATNCFNGTTGLVPGCTDTGNFYAFPTIAVNNINDVMIGFSHFSPTRWATAAYAYRDHTDAPNTFREVADYKEAATSGRYSKSGNGVVRWGDYSATMIDPLDDRNFWTTQEYAEVRANAGATSVYATWWAKVDALSQAANAGNLVISEFRLAGPSGAQDEFIEIYNKTNSPHTVSAIDVATGGTAYAVVASDGVVRCTIPNGTVIPARGHFLCANSTPSVGYSLSAYPAGDGTTATADATYTLDIPANAGIALFRTATPAGFTLANRLDAVGSTAEANVLYKEGAGYPPVTLFPEHSFYRHLHSGTPQDTNDNAADFLFVDTNAFSVGAGQRLGAPGPENLSSPIVRNSTIKPSLIDLAAAATASPNRVRNTTPNNCNGGTSANPSGTCGAGTLDIRRKFTNTTAANVTRLRFRIVDVTTFPPPAVGTADLRALTSPDLMVSTSGGSVLVRGTTLEQPPAQPNGGGMNSSLSAGTITLATPLAPGASIDVRFLLGVQQTGSFRFFVNVEALP